MLTLKPAVVSLAISLCLLASNSAALASAPADLTGTPIPPSVPFKDKSFYNTKPLDGIPIEAVETYPNPNNNELGLGLSLYSFNPYYTGLLLTAAYQHNFSRTLSWEIVNAGYAYSFEKGLTTELADNFGVNPQKIDRLKFLVSSNLMLSLVNGKFVVGKTYTRYFRGLLIGGLGLVNTSQSTSAGPVLGVRVEVFSGDSFAWRFDIRDSVAVSGFNQYVTFSLGSGFSF